MPHQTAECKATSIIVLTHNQLTYTQACIDSIRKHTSDTPYEIIIVDNHSTDGTPEWLSQQSDIRTIFNDDNRGFPTGCNQGIEIAKGEAILLLNNDTVVTENWLTLLLDCLYSEPSIGAVGPVTNNCSNYQTIPVSYPSLLEMQLFAGQYNQRDPDKWERRLKLVGFCMLIKRSIVDEIGLLDERFSPGNFEDDDYSLRILQAGYQLILCKNVFIHHFGSTSFKTNPEQYRRLLHDNEKKFTDKWGFGPTSNTTIRYDLLGLMDTTLSADKQPMRILDINCACGGTLLQIKTQYPHAELYGVAKSPSEGKIASQFSKISDGGLESIEYPYDFFDYIFLGDVLQNVMDPWELLERARKYLKNNGKLIASIPNVMYVDVLKRLIQGEWSYGGKQEWLYGGESGIPRDQVRFYSLQEIDRMFINAGYASRFYTGIVAALSDESSKWVEQFGRMSMMANTDQFKVTHYLVKAMR